MYTNPILKGLNPDPSICRAGTDYYIATSTMYLYPGIPIYHSRDLVHWTLIGHALTRSEQFLINQNSSTPMIFAPTLRFHEGTFYLITTNVHGGGNFYVTTSDPAGEWSNPIFVDAEVFDPSLMFDTDGKVYYTRRGPGHSKDIVQSEIDIASGNLKTPLAGISQGLVSDDAEAPHLYHIGDWYYLLLAEGGSRFLHMGTIARSRSPWGPFEPCPRNPVLAQHHAWWHDVKSIGHGDLVEAHDGSWWMVYLGTRHTSYDSLSLIGRETFLSPVTWVDDWPVLNLSAQRSLVVDVPTLPQLPVPAGRTRDDFNTVHLDLRWTFLTIPEPGLYSLTERPGYMRLWGTSSVLTEGTQSAFAGWRQEDFTFECSSCLEFNPDLENEQAGIAVFHRHDFYYAISVSRQGGGRVVQLIKQIGDIHHTNSPIPVEDGPILLTVVGKVDTYEFYYKTNDGLRTFVGSALAQLISSEVVGSWSGVLIGMFSGGSNAKNTTPADFDWFEMHKVNS